MQISILRRVKGARKETNPVFANFVRRLVLSLVFVATFWAITGISAFSEPSIFPTGTTIYDPHKAYNCFVLFSAPDGKTHLIDMDGNEVHRWDYFAFPAELIDPAKVGGKKGHLVVQSKNGPSPAEWGGIFANLEVSEVDWDGKVVWHWGGGHARDRRASEP